MSVQSEINRINQNVAATYSVLSEAGAAMPASANTDNLAATAAGIKAVLYGKAQSLTDAQKAQARENIGLVIKPDYVVTEAMEVLDKVVAAQGSRTFVLGAITDMHYGSSDYVDGVIHATQGLKHISDRIKMDVLAVLGDYTDEHQMNTEAAFTDREECNALISKIDVDKLCLKGNHDHTPGGDAQTYRTITAYSDNAVWGSRLGGYFFRDFDAYKLRIICLNTTEVARDNLSVSNEQYQWFADTLDVSSKEDAAEWGILILSHHPVDWTVTDGNYRFDKIINAYQSGTSWTDGTISCDYADKNDAPIIANIHGHLHNLLTDKISGTNVNRLCTPASRVDFVNHYTDAWKEATTYNKTKNTAEDTSFCVYCIDLDARTIKAFCYGAGYDRSITYDAGGATAPSYTNQIPISTDTDGSIYNGTGYANGTRLTSTGAVNSHSSFSTTGFIPFVNGNVLRSSDGMFDATDTTGYPRISFYKSDRTYIREQKITESALSGNAYISVTNGALYFNGDIKNMFDSTTAADTAYIRICASTINSDSIITVNEEIV